jgi:hypothetical protein
MSCTATIRSKTNGEEFIESRETFPWIIMRVQILEANLRGFEEASSLEKTQMHADGAAKLPNNINVFTIS